MSKKIMIVCGSPRKHGNTNRVVGWAADAARQAGAQVEIVDAARLDYKTNGCTACMSCQKSEDYGCVIDDEAKPVIARMTGADALVISSPVYWMGPTAQLKLLLDRMFSLFKLAVEPIRSGLKDNATLAVISTAAGSMDEGLSLVENTFKLTADFFHFPFHSILLPHAPENPEDIETNAELKEEAATLGKALAGA